MAGSVLVFAESSDSSFRKSSFEALTEGRRLADLLGAQEYALGLGYRIKEEAPRLGKYGVDHILLADDPNLALYNPDFYLGAMLEPIRKLSPSILLLPATSTGKDLAPRLAIHLNAGLASECVQLELQNNELIGTRPAYAGKVLLKVKVTGSTKIATLRPNAFTAKEQASPKVPMVDVLPFIQPASRMQVRDFVVPEGKKVDLTEANVIVSGGRGMGGPANYKILQELADVIGGVVGASRASVDAGWRPHSDQVGQTGRTVSPTLYIACGISGAIQHKVGMATSKVIVAINKDPEAPIFGFADYGIVGDVFEVVPALTQELKKFYGKS